MKPNKDHAPAARSRRLPQDFGRLTDRSMPRENAPPVDSQLGVRLVRLSALTSRVSGLSVTANEIGDAYHGPALRGGEGNADNRPHPSGLLDRLDLYLCDLEGEIVAAEGALARMVGV